MLFMKKKIMVVVIIMLYAALLLTSCSRQFENNNLEIDDYLADLSSLSEAMDENKYQNKSGVVISDGMPEEAKQLILTHFEAIRNGDRQSLVDTFNIEGANFAERHYINWLADELISRFNGAELLAIEIDDFWDGVMHINAHVANNLGDSIENLFFYIDGLDVLDIEGYSWYIIAYTNDFGYHDTLGFVNYEGIQVDSRITVEEASLIHAVVSFIDALESGDSRRFLEQQTGLSLDMRTNLFFDSLQGTDASIYKIEILPDSRFVWRVSSVKAAVTVDLKNYGIQIALEMFFEPFERLGGEQLWLLTSTHIDVSGYINGLKYYVATDIDSIYDLIALNFIMTHYPAHFLNSTVLRSVSNMYGSNRGVNDPIPRGMNNFGTGYAIVEPFQFFMYKINNGLGEETIVMTVDADVRSQSEWWQRVYGLFDGEFRLITELNDNRLVSFWRGRRIEEREPRRLIPFISIWEGDYHDFRTLDVVELRDRNELVTSRIRQVHNGVIHDDAPELNRIDHFIGTDVVEWSRLERFIGIDDIEVLAPVVSVRHGDSSRWDWYGAFADQWVRSHAAAKSVEHIEHPADRLILGVTSVSSVIRSSGRVGVIPVVYENGEYGEWVLIVDDNIYMFNSFNPQLLDFMGSALPNVSGDIIWMDPVDNESDDLINVIAFIRDIKAINN